MKVKQLFASFLACMALWSAPVYAAFDVYNLIGWFRYQLSEATNKKKNTEKRSAARGVRSRMSQSFKEYTGEIENVRFGMGKSKINKGIQKLTSILDKIEDHLKSRKLKKTTG